MKIVAMIPARLGSTRVPKKNLRLLNGIPLIFYPIVLCKKVDIFDDVYLNSDAFILKKIAKEQGVKFYERSEYLCSDTATNDEFVYDFINNVKCDVIIQVLSTSPFITKKEIKNFVAYMLDNKYETLISVKNEQIECIYDGKPINFKQKGQTLPSQQLKPIQLYACSLMGWNVKRFKNNMKKYNSGYHGGDGSIGFFELNGFSSIDIDEEDDFQLCEGICSYLKNKNIERKYYV